MQVEVKTWLRRNALLGAMMITDWLDYAVRRRMWQKVITEKEFDAEWEEERKDSKACKKSLSYILRIKERAVETWGEENALTLFRFPISKCS
ncbi:hypothetical protein N7462_008280 [Penicillium macrosclerotiorum]|uniref:uncharacterized protein n=1 Tax=Penicillium macrosclerotiorum TaxID=303699 RepID=UPI0025493E4F|nr:uncharacterized protein N7462_008280 [Penicillium macrosclerotiorum]KAJ5675383.1 hypothetical protein N7462_008280 [Penicillium macrosclerotiorum]